MTNKILENSGDEFLYENGMSILLAKNPVIALICGYHVASSLHLSLFSEDYNPQWSILGESSIGKTLALKTAMSLGQNPANLRVLDSFSVNVETHFKDFDNIGGIADESGTLSPNRAVNILREFSHGLTNNSETNKKRHCRYTLLLSGETPLPPGRMENLRITQTVFTKANPLWHSITTRDDAQAWNEFIYNNYGHVYPKLLSLVRQDATGGNALYEKIKQASNPDMTLSEERKKAHEYALAMTGVTLLAEVLNFKQYIPSIEKSARQLFCQHGA